MENEILSLIIQAGSGAAPLIALYLYHQSITKVLGILVQTLIDNQRLTNVLLDAENDKETLKSLLITGIETYGTPRKTREGREDRPTQERTASPARADSQ